ASPRTKPSTTNRTPAQAKTIAKARAAAHPAITGAKARTVARAKEGAAPCPTSPRRAEGATAAASPLFRACLENISGGLAMGRGGWLRCSPVTDTSLESAPSLRLTDLFSKHA